MLSENIALCVEIRRIPSMFHFLLALLLELPEAFPCFTTILHTTSDSTIPSDSAMENSIDERKPMMRKPKKLTENF